MIGKRRRKSYDVGQSDAVWTWPAVQIESLNNGRELQKDDEVVSTVVRRSVHPSTWYLLRPTYFIIAYVVRQDVSHRVDMLHRAADNKTIRHASANTFCPYRTKRCSPDWLSNRLNLLNARTVSVLTIHGRGFSLVPCMTTSSGHIRDW